MMFTTGSSAKVAILSLLKLGLVSHMLFHCLQYIDVGYGHRIEDSVFWLQVTNVDTTRLNPGLCSQQIVLDLNTFSVQLLLGLSSTGTLIG